MKKIVLIVVTLLIIFLAVLLYLGWLPGLSSVLGTNRPQDLGVQATSQDLEQAAKKTNVAVLPLPAGMSNNLVYEGSHSVEEKFSSEEITALANSSRWKYNPLSEVQVKINEDGSAEASGYIDFATAHGYLESLGVNPQQLESVVNKYHVSRLKLPFYVKARGEVNQDQVSLQVDDLRLARLPVPAAIITSYLDPAIEFIEYQYLSNDAVNIDKLENQGGEVYLRGSLPDKEMSAW